MNIVQFPGRAPAPSEWSADEWRTLVALFHPDPTGHGTSWDIGATEHGDPQFYLLGAAPDHECLLCVSRLAQGYVLEDGGGRILGEAPSLDRFAEQAARAAARRGRSFVARVTLLLCAIRLTIEEKIEPLFEESQELLVRFAPQIAAFV